MVAGVAGQQQRQPQQHEGGVQAQNPQLVAALGEEPFQCQGDVDECNVRITSTIVNLIPTLPLEEASHKMLDKVPIPRGELGISC